MRKLALALALLTLTGCASGFVVICPEYRAEETKTLPPCTAELEGCFAWAGDDAQLCQDGEWQAVTPQ